METSQGDSIHLTELQLPHGVLVPDIWGVRQVKSSPATISVDMHLGTGGFQSAAQGDALDQSTLHYGLVAKRLRDTLASAKRVGEVLALGVHVLEEMNQLATTSLHRTGPLSRARVSIELEKGGMFAEGVRVFHDTPFQGVVGPEEGCCGIEIRDVSMKVLIGVNDYERTKPQLVHGTIHCSWDTKKEENFVEQLFVLESLLLKVVEDTDFETLESLAQHTMRQLQIHLLADLIPNGWVKLRLAKPRAVAFAKAPAVEICRRMTRNSGGLLGMPVDRAPIRPNDGGALAEMAIIRPYIS